MTKEERIEYAKEQISILSEIEKAKQPSNNIPPNTPPNSNTEQPIDFNNLQ